MLNDCDAFCHEFSLWRRASFQIENEILIMRMTAKIVWNWTLPFVWCAHCRYTTPPGTWMSRRLPRIAFIVLGFCYPNQISTMNHMHSTLEHGRRTHIGATSPIRTHTHTRTHGACHSVSFIHIFPLPSSRNQSVFYNLREHTWRKCPVFPFFNLTFCWCCWKTLWTNQLEYCQNCKTPTRPIYRSREVAIIRGGLIYVTIVWWKRLHI